MEESARGGAVESRDGTFARRLENGLTVLVRRLPDTEVAAVFTRVEAGYFDEPDDAVGISHVLEHMYFKGTERRGPGDIAREIRAAGGTMNASTIYDRTTYYAVVPSDALVRALDVQADALANARIDAQQLERELRVIIEEVKRKRDTPAAVAYEALLAAMFDRHRIRRWRAGTEAELARFDDRAVRAFHDAHYRPANVVLSIAGDVDPDATLAEVERLFGVLPPRSGQRDRGPAEPERRGYRFRELDGDLHRTYLRWGWRTRGPLHADTPALDLLSVLLGQGRASRLQRKVRETGLVQEIGASHYTPTELGVFSIGAVSEPGEAAAALDAIGGVLAALRSAGVSAGELNRAQRIVDARLLRQFETAEGQAGLMAEWQALGDWRWLEDYRLRLHDVSATMLHDVAARYLDPDHATVLVYRPRDAAPMAWRPDLSAGAPDADQAAPSPAASRPPPRPPAPRVDGAIHVYEHGAATVIVLPRKTAPLVSLAFAFRAGSSEEDAARPGATTLMVRTALKGTSSRDAAAVAEEVEGMGGVIAGAAGADAFEWTLGLPARHCEEGLDVLAEVALQPAFPAPELEVERKALLGELAQLRDDMHGYPFRLMLEAAFEGHRYGAPLERLERTVREVDAAEIAAWHARAVTARPLFVLVVGDIDADAVAAHVIARLDPILREAAPPAPEFRWPAGRRVRVVERDTAQTAIALGFPGPPRNHADTDALQVLAAAVGVPGGRLVEELRSRRSLAYAVTAGPVARGAAGVFACYIATTPEREHEARDGMLAEIARLVANPLPDEDIERARRYLIGSRRIRLQTHAARLGELAGALLLGRGIEEIRDYEARIRAIGPERIRQAAATWLDPGRVAEGIVRGSGAGSA